MIINKEYFKQYSPIPKNYNLDEVILYVPIAEDIWLKPLIGESLLSEIQYQVDNDTVSDNNATLLTTGGLWKYLCYAACYEALPFITYKITEVGLVKSDSDNSKSVDTKEYAVVEQHLRRQVEVLKEQVLEWLCSHQEQFPLFDNCQCSCCDNGLKTPNADWKLYGLSKKCTDLR